MDGHKPGHNVQQESLKESRPRTRFVTREEFARLHDAASEDLKPILVLAVETGLRKEELLGLKVSSIDFRLREFHLEVTKTNTPRRVPLSGKALDTIRELLEGRSRPPSSYLFCKSDGSRVGNPKRRSLEHALALGLSTSVSTISVTHSRWWVQEGGDLYRLSRVLGHATLQDVGALRPSPNR